MKVKEIDRTANTCWSPEHVFPIYLATGTAGQQLDSSFSTSAALEIFTLNLTDPGNDLKSVASIPSEERFYKLIWGKSGPGTSGTLVTGCDRGIIQIFDVSKLLNNENGLILRNDKHTGPVRALDFNAFQTNLLASGSSESEIYIWDLNNASNAMTPGGTMQPPEDVTSLAWNKQVQHILTTSFASKCVVWDLRKNDPIIKLTDGSCRLKWSDVAWNPDVATQLCLTSEDDQTPVIQLWDLRFATSPVKILEGHHKGVLSVSWCRQDSDILLSCGKDNKLLAWNPNATYPGTELICDMTSTSQWNFSVSWCPRHPALFSCCSFDGHVSVCSIVGAPQQPQTTKKIADSFPGMELYAQTPVPQVQSAPPIDLKIAPKWLKRPAVTKFGFGGKLVVAQQKSVTLCQVTTEPSLVARANLLDAALRNASYIEYCQGKVAASTEEHEKTLWQFLTAAFSPNTREQYLDLLGFQNTELNEKIAKISLRKSSVSDRLATLGRSTDSDSEYDGTDDFGDNHRFTQGPDGESNSKDDLSLNDSFNLTSNPFNKIGGRSYKISTSEDTDGLVCEALLLGNIEAAVEICVRDDRWADAIILAMSGGPDLLNKTQQRYLQENPGCLAKLISAVVTEDWTPVIENCDVSSWKEALVAAITHADDEFPTLCEVLGDRLDSRTAQLCFLCAGNLQKLVLAWLQDNNASNSDCLQDLVEVIMLLRAALQMKGRNVDLTGSTGSLLSQYAQILASEGNLEMALTYLDTSQDDQVQQLKERLYYSIGLGRQTQQQQPVEPKVAFKKTIQKPSNSFQPIQNQPVPQAKFASNSNVPSHMPPEPLPPSSASGITSRHKHVADPSVGSHYGAPGLPMAPIQQTYQPTQTQYSNYQPMPQPQQPTPTQYSNYQPIPQPQQPTNPGLHMPPPPSQTTNPPGWNDPPPLNTSRKQEEASACHAGTKKWQQIINHSHSEKSHQQKPQEYVPPPIMQPLFYQSEATPAPNGLMDPYGNQKGPGLIPQQNFPSAPPVSSQHQSINAYNTAPPSLQTKIGPTSEVMPNSFPPPPLPGQVVSKPSYGGPTQQPTPQSFNQTIGPPPPNTFPYGQQQQQPAPLLPPGPKAQSPYNPQSQLQQTSQSMYPPPPNQSNSFGNPGLPTLANPSTQKAPSYGPPTTAAPYGMPPSQPNPSQIQPPNSQFPPPMQPPTSHSNLQSSFGDVGINQSLPVPPPQVPPTQTPSRPPSVPPLQPRPPSQNQIPIINPSSGNVPQGYQNQSAYPPSHGHSNIPAPEKPKLAIPEEHMHLQTVFDELRKRCIEAANNPQLKRKLDDVARKLDSLYEALGDGRLSKRTLDTLHDISQRVQNGDYPGGLTILPQLASGPDFSHIGAFMPGIKVLLMCALQLQVYL